MFKIARTLSSHLATYLSKPLPGYQRHYTAPIENILQIIEPGDILLVDGNSRISTAIKYLTQSTWSHACIYMGSVERTIDSPALVEADLNEGVTLVPLSKYRHYNLRICRPVGLTKEERAQLLSFVEARLGYRYDLKNIFDLMRYLIQNPAVPPRYRRRMISLGSGEPTRAICSTLIAQAFQSVHYPILPRAQPHGELGSIDVPEDSIPEAAMPDRDEIEYRQRHFTLFVPRDFDLSPFFRIVKPTIESGFDFHTFHWRADGALKAIKGSE